MIETIKKSISIICLIAVLLNLVLFSFRLISDLLFWIIIVICAIVAFPVMKIMDKSEKVKK